MKKNLLITLLSWLMCYSLSAQTTVTGNVSDENAQPIMGATVAEKGTTNGTFSNEDGSYSISVKDNNAILIFSSIGFATMEIPIGGQSVVNVGLMETTTELTGVEIVGSRSLNRSLTTSPVAVDYIDLKALSNERGQLDVNQLLHYLAPSFNANRQSGSDGADHIDPATLRGMGPDQTLVLINGHRRHQTSLVNIYGTRGRGNTGTDLDAIPVSSIDHIEILRDGAAAQYGSDAIAGVINIVLKQTTGEFEGNINGSMNKAQYRFDDKSFDGFSGSFGGNYGLKIGDQGGFFNVSMDYLSRGRTNRSNTLDIYPESGGVRDQFGEPEASNFGTMFNMNMPFGNNASFYAFGGYGFRSTSAYAFTRAADESRNVLSIYPDGFNPIIASKITDRSVSSGIKGSIYNWNTDFNNTFGSNRFHFYGDSTLNASLGDASPTQFDDGGTYFAQNTTTLDFTRFFSSALSGLNVAFGAEYRVENYQIFAGEEGSWQTYGPVVFSIDSVFDDYGVFIGLDTTYRPGGSQGFPGFRPANEVNRFRTNIAGYIDVEFNLTEDFLVDLAVRFENYSDFGETINGKVAARYGFGDVFALRASVSTGFRAPSLVQIYHNATFTNVQSGVIFDEYLAANNSPVARALGIPSLKEEEALNASFGFTLNPFTGFSATVDGYFVKVEDRIVLTGIFDNSDPDIGDELNAIGVIGAQFFTNAVNTTTTGVDIILSYSKYWNNQRLNLALIGNINKLKIDDIYTNEVLAGKEDSYFGAREQQFLIYSAPPTKMVFSAGYGMKKFSANLDVNQFGKVEFVDYSGNDYGYDAAITIDLSLGYDLTRNLQLNIGASNLTNAYPTGFGAIAGSTGYDPYETETGGAWDAVQMGWDGTFLFAKLGFRF